MHEGMLTLDTSPWTKHTRGVSSPIPNGHVSNDTQTYGVVFLEF